MAIDTTEEHAALREAVRGFLERHCPPGLSRARLDAEVDELPAFWAVLACQGWLGLHLPAADGGQGYGLVEMVVVLEELGRAIAPGPMLPTVLASALIARHGDTTLRAALLPSLSDGRAVGAVALDAGAMTGRAVDGGLVLTGTSGLVPGGALAATVVLPVMTAAGERWCVVDAADAVIDPVGGLDRTRWLARLTCDNVSVPAGRILAGLDRATVEDLAVVLFGADCVGGAAWCLETAAAYARIREQFGRPIGQFQGVKHRCADMLLRVEQARAVTWDAARALDADIDSDDAGAAGGVRHAASVAGALAPEAFHQCAKDCIQILGGIGFTWEHDAHLYLKRAAALRSLVGGADRWQRRLTARILDGDRRSLRVELPPEAEPIRAEIRGLLAGVAGLDETARRQALVAEGFAGPHWPRPWGRGAGAVEQLVIQEECAAAGFTRPSVLQPQIMEAVLAYGTPDQKERWIRPTLAGALAWCQLFSEPGAGSDLASLMTKAVRTDGGWLLSGQKVWSSLAREADLGQCLARTDATVPKHAGITCFILDMHAPGVEIRPLRELTGEAFFNEVFLSDVFVPDDDVLGPVGEGWRVTRATLASERVMQGTMSSLGLPGVAELLDLVRACGLDADPVVLDRVGRLLADDQSAAVLAHRSVLRALPGAGPGPESSVLKLVWVEHEQRIQELALSLLGATGAAAEADPAAAAWAHGFLSSRSLTIAGGTSEVQRNVIAERLLGLPRDP